MSTSSSSVGAWSPTASWRPSAPATPRAPPRHRGRRGGPGTLRPGGPQRLLRLDPGRPPPGPHERGRPVGRPAPGHDRHRHRPWCRRGHHRGRGPRLRPPGPRDRLVRLGAPGAGRRRHGRLRLPDHRRPRRPERLVAQRSAELGRPARGVVVGGGLLGRPRARSSASRPTAPSSSSRRGSWPSGRRGRRRRAAPHHRGHGRRRPRRRRQRVDHRRRGRSGRRAAGGRDEQDLPADVVVFATGVRPRDELAAPAGLATGPRGVVVDEGCRTADPRVSAIGEVACIEGRCPGLVAPGYTMAEVTVDRLLGGDATFPGADLSTKPAARRRRRLVRRRVRGDTGRARACTPDPVSGVYKQLVVTDDARTLLGGILVGDASAYASLRPMVGAELGSDPGLWLLPRMPVPSVRRSTSPTRRSGSCNAVTGRRRPVRRLGAGLPRRQRRRRARGPGRRAAPASRSSRSSWAPRWRSRG